MPSSPAQKVVSAATRTARPVWVESSGNIHDCDEDQMLIAEEPLSIHVEGRPYSVVMRTPGEENVHIAGFCMSEGIIDTMDDIATLGYCTDMEGHVATVTLHPERRKLVSHLLERRGFLSQTSCGICGKALIRELRQILNPISDDRRLGADSALTCVRSFHRHQALYAATRSAHGAALFDDTLETIAMSEDVGRHNAMDKAIGKALMDGRLAKVHLGVLSSRISYELVQKAGRAGLPILIGMSRPTDLAVRLAEDLKITLARPHYRHEGLILYTCPFRIRGNGNRGD